MARPRNDNTIQTLKEKYDAGRGQGIKENYCPWIWVNDFSSSGLTSELIGWTTGRLHQLFSNGERNYFQLLDWDESVVDIREQYPLLDDGQPSIFRTQQIATWLGYQHPAKPKSRLPIVMTTDFVITREQGGQLVTEARAFKLSSELKDDRTIEKLEIERIYWEELGVNWRVVTEKSLNLIKVKNIDNIRMPRLMFEYNNITSESAAAVASGYMQNDSLWEMPLFAACLVLDERIGLKEGTALNSVKYLISTRTWNIDMNIPFSTHRPLTLIDRKDGI